MKRTILAFLAFTAMAALADVSAETTSIYASTEAVINGCKADAEARRFAPIRDKMVIYLEDVNPTMTLLNRKPTPAELVAIRAVYDLNITCAAKLAATAGGTLPAPLKLGPWAMKRLGALSLLINGYGTYADYAEAVQAQAEESQAEAKTMAEKYRAELQRAQSLLLVCEAEWPEQVKGVEFQYQVNPIENKVAQSRGSGEPRDVRISDSEISFSMGQGGSVSISRVTGNLMITNGGAMIKGKCTKATSKAF